MWKEKIYDKTKESMLIQKGLHKMVARLISGRNIDVENVDKFLSSDYQNLSHPHKLHDLEKAVDIFIDVAKRKGTIKVWSDYDADGVLSAVMIKELCNVFGLECICMFSSRLEHGYGLNEKAVAEIKIREQDSKTDLLFILDSGTNSFNEIENLKRTLTAKIIIIDHHTGDEGTISTNADALITWHLSDGLNEMCACGEVFQFIRGIRWLTKKVNPIEFLAFAAIGTVADVSPIIGDNRIIVKNGLSQYAINHVSGAGLHSLLIQSKIHPSCLTQEDVAFRIAPRINAVGRMSKPDAVYDLLMERDVKSAENLAEYILTYNDERKKIQKRIEDEAKSIADKNKFSHGTLVYDKGWHVGVVGIVAARLADTYNQPSLVVGYKDGSWKGSGRSLPGINIKEILDLCPEIFEKYGGHAGAVGLTLKAGTLEKAPEIFNEACKTYLKNHSSQNISDKYFDATLKPQAVSPKTCKILIEQMYPYCKENNAEPLFKLKDVNIVDADYIEKETWSLLKFHVEKDGYKIPHSFKTFSPPCGSEIEGRRANIIFSFPQKTEDPSNYFFSFELGVIDLELL
ncbi:MAG: DHHA1 domain-containing protein [Synergistaceae bacterium]